MNAAIERLAVILVQQEHDIPTEGQQAQAGKEPLSKAAIVEAAIEHIQQLRLEVRPLNPSRKLSDVGCQ